MIELTNTENRALRLLATQLCWFFGESDRIKDVHERLREFVSKKALTHGQVRSLISKIVNQLDTFFAEGEVNDDLDSFLEKLFDSLS